VLRELPCFLMLDDLSRHGVAYREIYLLLTPPFGFALFYLRGVADDSVATSDIYQGVIPFVFIQICLLGTLWLIPDIVTWLPSMMGR